MDMAKPNNRVLSGLSGRRELCVPSLPFSASKHIAIKFSSTHFHLGYSLQLQLQLPPVNSKSKSKSKLCGVSLNIPRAMATGVQEVLPPPLTSTSPPPSLFDGTTRLYISYKCPYAQRVWITRNCKGLQDKIQLVSIDLQEGLLGIRKKLFGLEISYGGAPLVEVGVLLKAVVVHLQRL